MAEPNRVSRKTGRTFAARSAGKAKKGSNDNRGKPFVSVVMPTRNYAHFIGEAIESLLVQTYRHFELIIVDDASTDDTLEVIDRYRDDRIAVVQRSESALSPDTPRNDGLAAARGILIANADSDDINVPERLGWQVAFLNRHPGIDLLGGGMISIDRQGRPIGRPVLRPVYQEHPGRYRIDLLEGKSVIANPTLMFRRSVSDKLNGFKDYPYSGDYEFLLRASRYFRFCNLDRVLVYHRSHRDSTTRRYGNRLSRHNHRIFLEQEYRWVQHEIERLGKERQG